MLPLLLIAIAAALACTARAAQLAPGPVAAGLGVPTMTVVQLEELVNDFAFYDPDHFLMLAGQAVHLNRPHIFNTLIHLFSDLIPHDDPRWVLLNRRLWTSRRKQMDPFIRTMLEGGRCDAGHMVRHVTSFIGARNDPAGARITVTRLSMLQSNCKAERAPLEDLVQAIRGLQVARLSAFATQWLDHVLALGPPWPHTAVTRSSRHTMAAVNIHMTDDAIVEPAPAGPEGFRFTYGREFHVLPTAGAEGLLLDGGAAFVNQSPSAVGVIKGPASGELRRDLLSLGEEDLCRRIAGDEHRLRLAQWNCRQEPISLARAVIRGSNLVIKATGNAGIWAATIDGPAGSDEATVTVIADTIWMGPDGQLGDEVTLPLGRHSSRIVILLVGDRTLFSGGFHPLSLSGALRFTELEGFDEMMRCWMRTYRLPDGGAERVGADALAAVDPVAVAAWIHR